MKRGEVLWFVALVLLVFIIPFVAAENGCCELTSYGDTCLYTAEENCEGGFHEGAECEGTDACRVGCCVTSDGGCGENTGSLTCDLAEGVFYAEQECDVVSSCAMVCCQVGEDYGYVTSGECTVLGEAAGVEALAHTVSSESACTKLASAEENGCCVLESSGCTYVTQEECGETTYDSLTGYGFYIGEACVDVASYLDDKGFVASDECTCEIDESLNTCDAEGRIVEVDTCENWGDVVGECDWPDEVCSTASGTAACVNTECPDTFSFPDGAFETFNRYPVYYQSGEDWVPTMLQLGDPRRNFESWCIYESPVGSFRDRVGSQHYLASCVNGEEQITNCASDRSEVCVTTYDASEGTFTAGCVPNNFDTYFSEISDEYSGNVYSETDHEVLEQGGFSTITTATEEYCELGSVACDLVYGDTTAEKNGEGWELYVNAYCLRETFSMVATDYCSSRGQCGLQKNVAGDWGEDDGMVVDFAPDEVYDAEVGCGGEEDCFDPGHVSGPNDLAEKMQCRDLGGCTQFDVEEIKNGYKALVEQATSRTIVYNFLTEFMAPYNIGTFEGAEKLLSDSGAESSDCIAGDQRVQSILYGLGTDVYAEDWYTFVGGSGSWDYIALRDCGGDCVSACERDLCLNTCRGVSGADVCSGLSGDEQEACSQAVDACYEECAERGIAETCDTACDAQPCPTACNEEFCDEDIMGEPFTMPIVIDQSSGGALSTTFFNSFRSLKPWVLDPASLSSTPVEDIGTEGFRYFTIYDGDSGGCGGDTEWQDAFRQITEHVSANFNCGAWQPPAGLDNCGLCDLPVSDGGLVFTNSDIVYPGSYCNPFRCESLGADCYYVGENYGTGRPSCVAQACELGGTFAYVGPYEQALEDSGLSVVSSGDGGYEVNDIPVGQTFSFGLETSHYAQCLFVQEEDIGDLTIAFGVENVQSLGGSALYRDDATFWDTVAQYAIEETPVWGAELSCDPASDESCVERMDTYHNFTMSIGNSEEEHRLYVWCKDVCGAVKKDYYQITLESGFAPPDTPPQMVSIDPPSGSYVLASATDVFATLYLDVESTCKYSSVPTEGYDLMATEGACTTIGAGDDGTFLGYFPCSLTIPLDSGTTTRYFLCADIYGNQQTEPFEWYILRSPPLEITQVAPSGTQYSLPIVLQVGTSDDATCSYALREGEPLQTMYLSEGTYHEQTLTPPKDDYNVQVSCQDEVGNVAEAVITFTVAEDTTPPVITNVYYLGTTLYLLTDELTNCEYSTEAFAYGEGTALAGTATTAHTFMPEDLTTTYTILCIDGYGNEGEAVGVNLAYLVGA